MKNESEESAQGAGSDTGAQEAESDEAAKASAEAENMTDNATAPKTKTRIKKVKVSLDVAEDFEGIMPRPRSSAEKANASARIMAMEEFEKEVRRVEAAKNALESFVYESRGKINDDENHIQVSTEEQRAAVQELSMSLEEWLYEEEAMTANASLFETKLATLQELAYPIMRRAHELEQRPLLEEIIEKVMLYTNQTLAYVEKNMTWVDAKEREGVQNLTIAFDTWYANVTELQAKRSLSEEPAFETRDAKMRLHKIQSEAQRLTKIRKIDPMPYSSDYGKYGGYGGYNYNDPKWREYYDAMYRNFSGNGSQHDWFRNFSNFSNYSGWNNSDYMKSFYEHYARGSNFSQDGTENTSSSAGAEGEKDEL